MKTALIVLNYNDYVNTSKFVNNIKNYNNIDRIIVVDNLSTDGKYEELLKLDDSNKINVVQSDKNGGYAYGNNYGINMLDDSFDFVIISNPDVFVEEKSIDKCLEVLNSNEKIAIAAPRMKFESGLARRSAWKKRNFITDIANSTRLTQLLLYYFFKKGEYNNKNFEKELLEVDNIAGSFFVVKKNIFKQIGYFDENTFLFYEEDILGNKLSKLDYKIISINNINFIHYDSQTIGKLMNVFKKQKILFNSRKYYHKTYNKINKLLLYIFDILYFLRMLELVIEIPIKKVLSKLK